MPPANGLNEVFALPDTITDDGQLSPAGYALTVTKLSFRYPDSNRPALSKIDFSLGENQVLGIVGATGAGKSTLLQLLMRYWEASAGVISIGATEIRSIPLHRLREHYAYVPQDAFLFSATISENIRMGRTDATDAEIMQAASLAAIHDDITNFPDGYNTQIGERGVTLSGGQRQRVSIARALICNAPILILDDALSAVDIETEKTIISHLRQYKTKTLIIVSHRLSAIEHADEIVVLSHGEILERGQHQQLVSGDGWYSRMSAYQQMELALEN